MHVHHKDVSEMTDEEKSFFYFKIHDTDNNDFLDGLEMIKAAIHRHGNLELQDELMHVTSKISWGLSGLTKSYLNHFNNILGVVDEFLDFADINQDGYLNYAEYVKAMNTSQQENEVNPALSAADLQNDIEN